MWQYGRTPSYLHFLFVLYFVSIFCLVVLHMRSGIAVPIPSNGGGESCLNVRQDALFEYICWIRCKHESFSQRIPPPLPSLNESSEFASYPLKRNAQPTMHLGNSCYLASHNHRYAFKGHYFAGVPHHNQVGINCSDNNKASRSLNAIDKRIIMNVRARYAVTACFPDKH